MATVRMVVMLVVGMMWPFLVRGGAVIDDGTMRNSSHECQAGERSGRHRDRALGVFDAVLSSGGDPAGLGAPRHEPRVRMAGIGLHRALGVEVIGDGDER